MSDNKYVPKLGDRVLYMGIAKIDNAIVINIINEDESLIRVDNDPLDYVIQNKDLKLKTRQ